jgi:hypothetical protein
VSGVNIGGTLEIEFVPGSGTWTDVTSYLETPLTITHPRADYVTREAAPTTLTFTLSNRPTGTGFSPFTPDSPASAFYPNIQRDRRIRFTASWASSTSVRFNGWIDTWTPNAGDGGLADPTVDVSASCILSRYARRTLMSPYTEAVRSGFQPTAYTDDIWPFDEPTDAIRVSGWTSDGAFDLRGAGKVIQPTTGSGSMALGVPDSTIIADGAATFTRGDTGSASPVMELPLPRGLPVARISAWVNFSQDPAGLTDDILGGWLANGTQVWRLYITIEAVTNNVVINVGDGNGVAYSFFNLGYPRDESWHWISILFITDGSTTAIVIRDKSIPDQAVAGGGTGWPFDPRYSDYLVVGGRMKHATPGKQTNTFQGSVSSLHVRYNDYGVSLSDRSATNVLWQAQDHVNHLTWYTRTYDQIIGGAVGGYIDGTGTSTGLDLDPTVVMYQNITPDALTAFNEIAATTGGRVSTLPNGRRSYTPLATSWPTAVSLTLDAAADLQISLGFGGTKDERPTRSTATGPAGTYTYIDTETEATTGQRLDGPSVDSRAGTLGQLQVIASRASSSTKARYSVGVDLPVMAADQTATIMGLAPGARIRVANLPSQIYGVTFMDVYASGWVEVYVPQDYSATFVYDTDPADDPPRALFDTAEYDRFGLDAASVVSGGTCVGNTGTGTVVVTTTTPFPTSGIFSLDLDWNGERITVSGVGGGTSPQTCTVTARGVAPTVARAHAAGETVDVYHSMALA